MANRPLLLLVLLSASVLAAGCAEPQPGQDSGANETAEGTTPPEDEGGAVEALTPAAGEALFEKAILDMPPRMGVDAVIKRDGEEILAMRGFLDNESGVSWFRMKADPAALGGADEEMPEAFGALFREGIEVYVTPTGSLYLAGGMAIVFPPDAETGFLPKPEESPLMGFFDNFRGGAQGEDAKDTEVLRVTPTTHRGKPAMAMDLRTTDENGTSEGTVVLYTSPPRLARVDMRMPEKPGAEEPDPFAGATIALDMLYDSEVPREGPEPVARALALAFETERDFQGSAWDEDGKLVTTWTFVGAGGIPLDEVEVVLKDQPAEEETSAASASGPAMPDVASLPARWSMKLSELRREEGNVTVAFTDADGDGMVSKGDTLRFTMPVSEKAMLLLRDAKTGTYVVPGPGLALGLALVGLAALTWRRAKRDP